MTRRYSTYLFLASSALAAAAVTLGHSNAMARVRSLAAPSPEIYEFNLPAPRVTEPVVGTDSRKRKIQLADNSPFAVHPSTSPGPSITAISSCALDPLTVPRTGASAANTTSAAKELEHLRATAMGTLAPDNAQLPKARQQRTQANAAWQMGLLTLHGICLPVNTADAEVWFERAQQLGAPLAPAGLAWCKIEGCKAAASPAAAQAWIVLLRSVDLPRAQYLQWLMRARMAPLELAQSSYRQSASSQQLPNRQLLANAAQLGDTNAKIEMGLDSVFSNKLAEALGFFKSAASRSAAASINASVVASRIKNASVPTPSNGASAVAPVKAQSALDNFTQAQRYHRGQGVPSNYTEAIRLYQLAQNQGSVAAKKMLELIFSRPTADGQIDLSWMQQLAQVELSGAVPSLEHGSTRQQLKREPTPLFELVPDVWRKYAASSIMA